MLGTTVPVTGTIQMPDGRLLTGRIQMTLSYSAARDTTANNMIVAETASFPVSNGTLPPSAQVTPNDVLEPANTTYRVEYFLSNGQKVAMNTYSIPQGGPFNLGAATPTPVTTSNISFTNFTGLDTVSSKRIGPVRYADQFPGGTADQKIAAAIADLPSSGGTVDARGLIGAQVFATDPFVGVSKPTTIVMGGGTFTSSVNLTVPANVNLQMLEGAILSMNTGTTLTIKGDLTGSSLSTHFAGAGLVSIPSATVTVYPQWWGATQNGTDDTNAFQLAINAAIQTGLPSGTLHLGAGTSLIYSTLNFRNTIGLRVVGEGAKSILQWTGDATSPMFLIEDCMQCDFSDFHITLGSGKTLNMGFQLQKGNAPVVSISQCEFSMIRINSAGGTLNYGWRMMVGPGGDINNDFHTFRRCWVETSAIAGWSIEGGNAQGLYFENCLSYGTQYGVTTRTNSPRAANFLWKGGFISATTACFFLGDNAAMGPIIIDGVQSETSGRLLDVQATNEGNGVFNYENAVHVRNIRFMVQNLNADTFAIKYVSAGPLIVEQSTFGFNVPAQISKAIAFYIVYQDEARVFGSCVFRNVTVNGSLTTVNDIFPQNKPTVMENVVYRAADTGSTGYLGGAIGQIHSHGLSPFFQLMGHSTAGNQRAGISMGIDETELWRWEARNDVGNSLTLLFNAVTEFLRMTATGNLMLLNNATLQVGASGNPISQMAVLTTSLTPTAVAANSTAIQSFTVTGLLTTDHLIVTPPFRVNGILEGIPRVSGMNTLELVWANVTIASLTPAAGTYTIVAIRM
jgi:hypothetical protein